LNLVVQIRLLTGTYYIYRNFVLFDTSALTSAATISASVLSLAGDTKTNADAGLLTTHIVASTPAATNDITTADYDQLGSTSFANIVYASISTGGTYNAFTLDSNGIANISKTGISKFGIKTDGDLNNNAPSGQNQIEFSSADNTGTSIDPKLVVTYTVVVGPANLKSYNTNLSANIKSIDTNLIANVKSLNTNV